VRLLLMDAGSKPIVSAAAQLTNTVECVTIPCAAQVVWQGTSDTDGILVIPRSAINQTTVVTTRTHEPRTLSAATWVEEKQVWALRLMGHAATACKKYDNPWTLLVADDWGSARLSSAHASRLDEFGLMHCKRTKTFSASAWARNFLTPVTP